MERTKETLSDDTKRVYLRPGDRFSCKPIISEDLSENHESYAFLGYRVYVEEFGVAISESVESTDEMFLPISSFEDLKTPEGEPAAFGLIIGKGRDVWGYVRSDVDNRQIVITPPEDWNKTPEETPNSVCLETAIGWNVPREYQERERIVEETLRWDDLEKGIR